MYLYRVCDEEEYGKIINNDSNIGKYMTGNPRLNNHKYKKDTKYLHFFAQESDILYLNNLKNKYLCTYNIPDELAAQHKGEAYYLDILNFKRIENVIEYAIPSDIIDLSYLEKVEQLIAEIDIDDYMQKDTPFKKDVYLKEKSKILKKIR